MIRRDQYPLCLKRIVLLRWSLNPHAGHENDQRN